MSKEAIIKVFEGVNVRIMWDDEKEEYFYSVNDIVEVLTESKDPRDYIKKMLKRDPELKASWGTICPPTRMRAADGKYYKTQAATMKGILRIVQSIPSRKAEPLKQWLAEEAAQAIGKDKTKAQKAMVKDSLTRAFDELHSGKVHHDARKLFTK